MKRNTIQLWSICLVIAGLLLFNACGSDDPASTDNGSTAGDPPEIPMLQGVDIDDSYFQDNQPTLEELQENGDAYEPYLRSKTLVTGMKAGLMEAFGLPSFFLSVSAQRDAEFQDGVWVWSFPFTVSGELIDEEEDFDVEVYITAEVNEAADIVVWEFQFSGTGTPFGNIEDFTIFEAETSLDNASGQLKFYSPENPDTPLLDLIWDVIASDDKEISVIFVDTGDEENGENGENGSPQIITIDYSQDETIFTFLISGGEYPPIDITWDTSGPEGTYSDPERECIWGEDLMAECTVVE